MRRYILLPILLAVMGAQAQPVSIKGKPPKNSEEVNRWPTFLSRGEVPDATLLLPPPPDTSSIAFLNDFDRYQWGKSVRATPRGREAVFDAHVRTDSVLYGFADAFGLHVTIETTPAIYYLIDRVINDGSAGVRAVKFKYMRKRPYVQFHEATPVPAEERVLMHTGSYPSGHSARGWAVALVLAEINPERQDAILKRGLDYGESRVIVGYHYQSDVDAARIVASAVVARLHADDAFQRQMAKAKKEFRKIKEGKD